MDGRDPLDDYHQINTELRLYQPLLAERPQIVALNKADLPEARANIARLREQIDLPKSQVFTIAAATHEGIDTLMQHVAAYLAELPAPDRTPSEEIVHWPLPEVDERLFAIEPRARAGVCAASGSSA